MLEPPKKRSKNPTPIVSAQYFFSHIQFFSSVDSIKINLRLAYNFKWNFSAGPDDRKMQPNIERNTAISKAAEALKEEVKKLEAYNKEFDDGWA